MPKRIKGVQGLNAILDRASELEAAREKAALTAAGNGSAHR
jgi:hypothetical protein